MRQPVDGLDVARRVADAMAGSQAAYTWLFRHFAPLVHAIHLGRTPHALAEELTQETFQVAFARLPQLREPERFGPWIAAIARRHTVRPQPSHATLDGRDDPSGEAGPDDVVEAARVLHAVRKLPEAYRETLLLRLAEGMSGPEIAALTGLTPASVRVNLHRGMARLRAALGVTAGIDEVNDGH